MERQHNLPDHTVQQRPLPPLWGSVPAAPHCPDLFPDLHKPGLLMRFATWRAGCRHLHSMVHRDFAKA